MVKPNRILISVILGSILLAIFTLGQAIAQETEVMLQQAATENKHLVVLAWGSDDETTVELKTMFGKARESLTDKALFYELKTDDTVNKDFVAKYQLSEAPLPIVLVFAPNDVIVGVFVQKVIDEETLTASFASPQLANVLKLLQDGNIVLLCVQSQTTKYNVESLEAAQAVVADERAKGQIQVVQLDSTDPGCADLAAPLNISTSLEEATTFIIVPPGTIAGEVKGVTTPAAMWDAIIKAVSACSSGGCGSGGCG